SAGFDALLPGAALPARLHRLPDGLRIGDGSAASRRLFRRDARDRPQLASVGAPCCGSTQVSTAEVTVPFVRRKLPASVRRKRFLVAVANHSLLIAASIAFIAPFVFITLTALMTNNQALSARLWPHPFAWHNFADVFTAAPMWRSALNTLESSGLATLGLLLSSIPVAYALARLRFRGRNLMFMIVLIALMLPPQV